MIAYDTLRDSLLAGQPFAERMIEPNVANAELDRRSVIRAKMCSDFGILGIKPTIPIDCVPPNLGHSANVRFPPNPGRSRV